MLIDQALSMTSEQNVAGIHEHAEAVQHRDDGVAGPERARGLDGADAVHGGGGAHEEAIVA